jgi:RNA polymerase sigma factor (sigma-70 family)
MEAQRIQDHQLIAMIRGSDEDRDKAFHFIYVESGWRAAAQTLILAAGGSVPDAEDAIQEAIIVLDNNIRIHKYQKTGSLKNYFIGISRGRWYSNKRSVYRMNWTDDIAKMDSRATPEPEVLMLEEEQKDIVRSLFNSLDERCKEVLLLYRLAYSMDEISRKLSLGNANNARQRVFNCRKKLVELALRNARFSEFLKE